MQRQWQPIICRQFIAAIQMLRQAIKLCPEPLWDDRSDGSPFWHLAYHTLYFTDFYLSEDEKTFKPRAYHVVNANFLPGDYGEIAGVVDTPETVFTREQLLDYADHCRAKCQSVFDRLEDEQVLQRCPIGWFDMVNTGELLLYNLRHVQHHAGQLSFMLRRRAGVSIEWLGTKDNQPPEPTW